MTLMNNGKPSRMTIALRGLIIILVLNLVVLTYIAWPSLKNRLPSDFATLFSEPSAVTPTPILPASSLVFTPTDAATETQTATPVIKFQSEADINITPYPGKLSEGIMILSIKDAGYYHLFAYQPESLPLTRLTGGNWDDIQPAISPDGKYIAYSSKKNGYWDLYRLELASGNITQLTNTPEYDGAPSWSPDGLWIVYETYNEDNLDLSILSMNPEQNVVVPLTNDSAAEFSPAWSPNGRQIAFVSNRSGETEIWIADLDQVSNRFFNLSQSPSAAEDHPSWSTDGNYLTWTSTSAGLSRIKNLDVRRAAEPAISIGNGETPVWNPASNLIAAYINDPNASYLTVYDPTSKLLILPPQLLPGPLNGFDWENITLPDPLPDALNVQRQLTPRPLWAAQITLLPDNSQQRVNLIELEQIQAPRPMLQDKVDESFQSLRARVIKETGWDFLDTLENAFVPLTAPLAPSMGDDWLYTGRAIAINTIPMSAGWMAVIREDHGADVYWRVYIRARYQDGSQGAPLKQPPWDFNARYSGKPQIYEEGGALSSEIPAGYWVDFTDLAASFGWERLPALLNWRTFFDAARLNEFVLSGGLDWQSAMLEIYPPEIFITPTAIIPPTRTPTPTNTPQYFNTATPTSLPPGAPTFTPNPLTPTVTGSPIPPTSTPLPPATMTQIPIDGTNTSPESDAPETPITPGAAP